MSRLPDCPHCRSRVRQHSRNNITPTTVECFARCLNPACPEHGQTLVYTMSYTRTTRRKIEVQLELALAVIQALPHAERAALRQMI